MIDTYHTDGFVADDHIYAAHPRPDWARRSWMSPDGSWTVVHRGRASSVRVPFPVGSTER